MVIPNKAKIYIIFLTILAIPLTYYISTNWELALFPVVIFWAILAIFSESLGITLPNGVGISVSFATHLACIINFGPFTAIIITASAYLFRVLTIQGSTHHLLNTSFHKTLFNVSQGIISSGIAGIIYVKSGGIIGEYVSVPTLLTVLSYLIINSILMSTLMAILNKKRFVSVWRATFIGVLPNIVAVSMIGVIIALAYMSYGIVAVLLFYGPLLLARFSFKLYIDMRTNYIETIQAFNKVLEAKDKYTSGHAERVQGYACKIAESMKISESQIQKISTAALLHDIGKIGIDDSILKKPGELTAEEYVAIQSHPSIGSNIIEGVDFLHDISHIVEQHHEKYDGTGYPKGLKGEEIRLEAAILSIADVYDAMTSDRPYRKALSTSFTIKELKLNSGTQFDPKIASHFIKIIEKESNE